ncbi:hypothetical protein MAPG_01235 [Magnaporthiopsis poae ATCC 64411]|uniref:Uncharacterized protein n=1 Tax=Magnaporthiopsis poae (strain ATCC 64411 / 73-15) TaxID=644358 RepID=A0A0C4DN59_MAGP6|nr:hypothetical protein MAPG_01235 [Magnaporthiopsis poae ATCC 64411]
MDGRGLNEFTQRFGLGFTVPITSFVAPTQTQFAAGQRVKVLPPGNLNPGSYMAGTVNSVARRDGGTFYYVTITSVVSPSGPKPYRDVQPRLCAEDELQAD